MQENPDGSPTVVTYVDGAKFLINIRSHDLVVDQTLAAGGCDSAPTPLELLGASLGSCIAYYMHRFLHTRGLPASDIRVEVTETKAKSPYRISAFNVKLFLPAEIPEQYLPLLHRVLESCPAHNTLQMGAAVSVEIETPALVAAG